MLSPRRLAIAITSFAFCPALQAEAGREIYYEHLLLLAFWRCQATVRNS